MTGIIEGSLTQTRALTRAARMIDRAINDFATRTREIASGRGGEFILMAGAYRGRPEDTARIAGIAGMLRSGMSWTAIQEATGCSRATIAKVRARAA
jgi:hypothetical protein